MRFSWKIWLIGSIFLLFPLADFRVMGVPLYIAEIPLLLLSISLPRLFFREKGTYWSVTDKKFVGWAALFSIGVVVTFFLKNLPVESLGLVKSFVILPVILAVILRFVAFSKGQQEVVLGFWYGGVVMAALTAIAWFSFEGTTYDGRLAAWYDSPNQLAFLLGPGVLLGIYFFYQWPTVSGTTMIIKMGVPLLIFWVLLLTRSYTMIGATLMAGLLLAYCLKGFENRKFFVWGVMGVAMIFFFWVVSEFPTEKFQSLMNLDERSSFSSRMTIWTVGLRAAGENFPWGIGIGQFQPVYLSYQVYYPPYLEWAVPEPHNLFLAILLAGGVMSLVAFFACLWLSMRHLMALYKEKKYLPLVFLYTNLLLSWLLTGMGDTLYFDNYLSLGWWGIIGLIWALGKSRE